MNWILNCLRAWQINNTRNKTSVEKYRTAEIPQLVLMELGVAVKLTTFLHIKYIVDTALHKSL